MFECDLAQGLQGVQIFAHSENSAVFQTNNSGACVSLKTRKTEAAFFCDAVRMFAARGGNAGAALFHAVRSLSFEA